MKNKSISEKLYERYKLHWMFTHNFTLADLFNRLGDFGDIETSDAYDDFQDYLDEEGFGCGSIWPSHHEFLDHEYQDTELMKSLCLSDQEWEDYQKSILPNLIFTNCGSGVVYWSNACGEPRHDKNEVVLEDLPAELFRAYHLFMTKNYNALCYLAERDGQYGLALVAEYATDLDTAQEPNLAAVQGKAMRLGRCAEMSCATIIANAYGGYREKHELIAFFPAMIKKAEFEAAVAKWREIVNS